MHTPHAFHTDLSIGPPLRQTTAGLVKLFTGPRQENICGTREPTRNRRSLTAMRRMPLRVDETNDRKPTANAAAAPEGVRERFRAPRQASPAAIIAARATFIELASFVRALPRLMRRAAVFVLLVVAAHGLASAPGLLLVRTPRAGVHAGRARRVAPVAAMEVMDPSYNLALGSLALGGLFGVPGSPLKSKVGAFAAGELDLPHAPPGAPSCLSLSLSLSLSLFLSLSLSLSRSRSRSLFLPPSLSLSHCLCM